MSDHRSQKLFLRALAGETLATPPVWLMRQAGRYLPEYRDLRRQAATFLEFCYTPDLTVEATLQPLRRYGFDAAILFSDILVIPDALGQPLQFQEGVGPVLEPLRRIEDLRKLSMERAEDHLAPVMTTVFRLSQEIPKTTSLIGFAGAPWTVATYMVEGRGGSDFSTIKGWAYKDPKGFSDLINLLVEVSSTYLINQIKNGAEAIQLFDTWAGVLSETQFQKWVIEPTRQIIQKIRQVSPSVPILGFPRGAGAMIETFVRETGVTGVSMDSSVSAKWATQHLQSLCTVQGNLDNQLLVAGGKALDQEVDRLVEILGRGPYIFNLGHGIVPQTPPEHVDQLVSRLRRDA